MAHILVENIQEAREDWLHIRRTKIGSSDISAIAGLNPYRSPLQVWAEKTGKLDPEPENDLMWLGSVLEPVVGAYFTRKTGIATNPVNALFVHPELDWAVASPDFWTQGEEGQGILEAKTTRAWKASEWDDGRVPTPAHMQLHWQLGIVGIPFGYAAALVGGAELRWARFDFEPDVFAQMAELAERFMEFVRTDTPPDPGPGDKDLIENLVGEREERTIELPAELEESVKEFRRCKAEAKDKKKELNRMEEMAEWHRNRLTLAMGSATVGVLGPYRVKLKQVHSRGYTVAPSSYWRFSVDGGTNENE